MLKRVCHSLRNFFGSPAAGKDGRDNPCGFPKRIEDWYSGRITVAFSLSSHSGDFCSNRDDVSQLYAAVLRPGYNVGCTEFWVQQSNYFFITNYYARGWKPDDVQD